MPISLGKMITITLEDNGERARAWLAKYGAGEKKGGGDAEV